MLQILICHDVGPAILAGLSLALRKADFVEQFRESIESEQVLYVLLIVEPLPGHVNLFQPLHSIHHKAMEAAAENAKKAIEEVADVGRSECLTVLNPLLENVPDFESAFVKAKAPTPEEFID